MRNKRPNIYSLKKIEKMNNEVQVRRDLAVRCGGRPVEITRNVYHSGKPYNVTKVFCIGGTCECGCGQKVAGDECRLHPHEKLWRGRGGVVSLENSVMVLNSCHEKLQNRSPRLEWLK